MQPLEDSANALPIELSSHFIKNVIYTATPRCDNTWSFRQARDSLPLFWKIHIIFPILEMCKNTIKKSFLCYEILSTFFQKQ